MPNCQECYKPLDIKEDMLEIGEVIACPNCGAEHEVISADPLELELIEEEK